MTPKPFQSLFHLSSLNVAWLRLPSLYVLILFTLVLPSPEILPSYQINHNSPSLFLIPVPWLWPSLVIYNFFKPFPTLRRTLLLSFTSLYPYHMLQTLLHSTLHYFFKIFPHIPHIHLALSYLGFFFFLPSLSPHFSAFL